MLKVGEAKFVTDIKGNEAECDVRNDGKRRHRRHLVVKAEAESPQHKAAEAIGADEHAADEICGNIRQLEPLEHAGHHKAREQAHRDAQKYLNGCHS